MKSLNCKKQTKKCISLLSAGALLLSALAGSFSVSAADAVINVKGYSSLATDDNWTPAIQKAIDTAAETGATVYIPSGEYPCEPAEEKESWEVTPATFYLPDAAVTIMGDGEETVLYKPRNESVTENSAAMFRTSYKSSAKITIKDIKISGNNNPGSNYGLIDGIVLNGSSNATVENVSIDGTKRHGIYMIAGANNNKIVNPVISNTNREMLGCGLQLEGAYNNTVINPVITNSGANAVDLSLWVPGGIYPANDGSNGSPYSSSDDYSSTGNVITGGMIAGTGIDNGNIGGGAFENNDNDDDYYGLNIIKGSNGNKISLDLIRDVRTADNYNSKAAAIRLYDVENNEINVKQVYNTKQYVLSFRDTCQNNSVTVGAACKIGKAAANNETYYESNTVSIIEEEFEAPGNVIRAKLNFTNGEEGIEKESKVALYSIQFPYSPERFGLYKDGKNITSIEGLDWNLEYDYALSDAVVGIGNIQVQGAGNWGVAGDVAADRTDGVGAWKAAVISLAGLGCNNYTQPLYCLALSVNTTAAVDTNKTYYAYCKERMIELVPCQNHFGHMRPWVQTDYNYLAECPNGFDDGPWGFKEPEILDPTDERSLELVTQMADDLLPYFSSDVYNINCDETNELGKGKSRELCEKIGTGRVYLNYILKLYEMAKSRGKRILMWGDIIKKYPELLPELPQDVTVLEWGYDDFEPTEQSCKLMRESGVNYIVCPGTNTWNSVTGRTTTMINNIKTAAVNGLKYGALGILCTDWGDNGHHQPLCVSYPGIVWAAANSWNCAGSHAADIPVILDRLVFSDKSGKMGQIVLDAGDYRQTEYKQPINITFTMHLMLSDFGDSKIIENAAAEDFIRIREYFADIKQRLLQTEPACEDSALIKEELETAADMVSWMQLIGFYYVCTRDGDANAAKKYLDDFVAQRESVYNRFKTCWLKRNKYGYLDKSLEKLDKPYTAAINAKE